MTTNTTTFVDGTTVISAAWLNDVDSEIFEHSVNVKQFGAVGNGVADDTTAIQAAINFIEQSRGTNGGVVFLPAGSYKCTSAIRIGGFVRLVGDNYLISSMFWTSTTGNCIELGPDESGTFGFSGSYTFASRLENLDLNGYNIDRGATACMVYTQGAHQFSGLRNVSIRNFCNIGIHHALGTGDPAIFVLEEVELQGSATIPAAGTTIGIKSSGGGANLKVENVTIQGDAANPLSEGILMVKDNLCLNIGHFEECVIGIHLTQNETIILQNEITSVTGHSTVTDLIKVDATNNLTYNLHSVSNQTILAVSINVLNDLADGVTIGGTGGTAVNSYSSEARRGGNNIAFAWANYLVGTGLNEKYNITSVTVNGTGDFTFTLSRAMNSTNTCPVVCGSFNPAAAGFFMPTVASTTTIRVKCYNSAGALADPQYINLVVHAVEN